MTKKKHEAREALSEAAHVLGGEIWDGKWEHIEGLHTTPIPKAHELLKELKERCPGHTDEAYEDALARGWYKY